MGTAAPGFEPNLPTSVREPLNTQSLPSPLMSHLALAQAHRCMPVPHMVIWHAPRR